MVCLLPGASAAAGFPHLSGPQCLAALNQAGLLGQDLVVEIDGVIKIVPLRGFVAFGEQHAQVARNIG